MKPHQFKRMLQAKVLLRGNGYALIVPGSPRKSPGAAPAATLGSKPSSSTTCASCTIWTSKDGSKVPLQQSDVFHLYGLTLNGYSGVTPLSYAAKTIGTLSP
jgi:phage portal protein BeeE